MAGQVQRCKSCVSCQSIDSCTCNSCESCNTKCNATTGCNTKQAFCVKNQSVGNFSFELSCSSFSGEIIDINNSWNGLLSYINNAYARGKKSNGGSSGLPSVDSNEFITADMFNKISDALAGLGSKTNNRQVLPDTYIYGSYFKELEDYADSLKYKEIQCDMCNAGCNVTCNGCQKCDSGNCTCNSGCQSNNPTYICSCTSKHSCTTQQTV